VASLFVKFSGTNQELLSALKEWHDMRKKMKKPLTEKAADLNLQDLQKLSGGDEQKMAEIVLQSVKRGWQGFYALKEAQGPRSTPQTESVGDFVNELSKFEQSLPKNNGPWDA